MAPLEWRLQNGSTDEFGTVWVSPLPYLGIATEVVFHKSESPLFWIKSCAFCTFQWLPNSAVWFDSEGGSHGYIHPKVISTLKKKSMTLMSFCESRKAQRHFQVSVFVKFQVAFLKIQL